MDKSWGSSDRLYLDAHTQVEHIEIEQGGFSSIHRHWCKSNLFHCHAGILIVRIYGDPLSLTVTRSETVAPGTHMVVPPLVIHQFFANSHVAAREVYWTSDEKTPLDPNDIERFSDNGIDETLVTSAQHVPGHPDYELPVWLVCAMCSSLCLATQMQVKDMDGARRHVCRQCVTTN